MTLSSREKNLLKLLAVFAGILIIFYGLIKPVMSFRESINTSGSSALLKLKEMENICRQYREIREKNKATEAMLKDTKGVSALVEENAQKSGISGNKIYNRDKETSLQNKMKKITTDVKFEGISISSALNFLYYMENSGKLIKTSSLRINQAVKERKNYDMTVSFDSYKQQ